MLPPPQAKGSTSFESKSGQIFLLSGERKWERFHEPQGRTCCWDWLVCWGGGGGPFWVKGKIVFKKQISFLFPILGITAGRMESKIQIKSFFFLPGHKCFGSKFSLIFLFFFFFSFLLNTPSPMEADAGSWS